MKEKLKKTAYAILLFSCVVSCKDNSPCIKDQCCTTDGNWGYVQTVSNARADLSRGGIFIEGIEQRKGDGFGICPNSTSKVQGLSISYMDTLNEPHYYKYRVWGKLLNCNDCRTSTAHNPWFLNIDKIERID